MPLRDNPSKRGAGGPGARDYAGDTASEIVFERSPAAS
jgi:hypothetical protein